MAKNVYLITLTSGTSIITSAVDEQDKTILLKDPLEMHLDVNHHGAEVFYLTRWNPFSENFTTLIYKSAIESMTVCSEKFTNLYNEKLAMFVASRTEVEDGDSTTVTEMDDSDELADGEYVEEDKTPITYH